MELSEGGRGRECGQMGREGRWEASQGGRKGSWLDPGASGEGAGSGGKGERVVGFEANVQVEGSEDDEGGLEEARMEAATMATAATPSRLTSPRGARSLGSPCQGPSLASAILHDDSGTTPGEETFSFSIQRTWKMSTFNSCG